MKNTNTLRFPSILRISILSVLFIAFSSLLMFGLVMTANAATLTRSLELGMRGSDVSDLQRYLSSNPSIYPSGLVTGYFGQLTKAAIERFQADNGIVSSGTPATTGYGRVGPITLAALNQKMSGGVTVNTGDNTSPAINSLNVSTSNTTASLSWNTNENASAIVYYSTSPISMTEASPTTGVFISGSSVLVNTNMQSSHSTTISGLTPNTNYYYVVYVRDVYGNESITWPAIFRTN